MLVACLGYRGNSGQGRGPAASPGVRSPLSKAGRALRHDAGSTSSFHTRGMMAQRTEDGFPAAGRVLVPLVSGSARSAG